MTDGIQRRLAAILAADVVGYTRLMGADEAGTLRRMIELREEVIHPLISEHRGRIVKLMGDGLLVEFASVVDSVACALAWQKDVTKHEADREKDTGLRFRIGINLGDVIVEGDDIHGDGVNIAARLEGLAEAGGICLSGDAYRQAKGKIEAEFEDLGEQELKNVTDPVRVYHVAVEAPAATTPGAAVEPLPLPDKPSIAVLPFDNLSGDPEQNYFADGMVEDIITEFSRIKWLFVIARNSSFTYKGKTVDIKQVGRELGVRYVLEGSVRKAGDRVRITGQLIDTLTGGHLWADRFDGEMADIFDLQDRVTQSVVGAIAPKLEQAEIDRAKRKPTESLDAYDYYLRGMAAFHQFTWAANQEAVQLFSHAFELDPEYAAAYGMAARTYAQRKGFGWIVNLEHEAAEARRLARLAASFAREDAVALASAGFSLMMFGEAGDGDALLDRALTVNPNLAWAWHTSGLSKALIGHPEALVERATHAMRLSPQDQQTFAMKMAIGLGHYLTGHYEEAYSWAESALREQPNFVHAACATAASAAQLGRLEDAKRAITRLREINPGLRISNIRDLLNFQRAEELERWTDGLRKAGLPE